MGKLRLVPLSAYHDDCRLLEVEPGAPLEEIKQAFRDQTKVWHPDRFSNDARLQNKAEERIKQISLAYRRLCGLSPYEQQVSRPAVRRSSSDWAIAFFALGRALRNSLILISKPFVSLIRTALNISNCVFQWCRREKRSLAIATSAFILGFGFGVWFLPRDSETWTKIASLLQRTIEKNGTVHAAVAQASAAPSTASPQTETVAASTPETEASVAPSPARISINPATIEASGDVFSSQTNTGTTPFSLSPEEITGKTVTEFAGAWEKYWLRSFGGGELTARNNYIPISFLPYQNTFYSAPPKSDLEQQPFNLEEPSAVSWSTHIHAEADHVIERQPPEEITRKRAAHSAPVETAHAEGSPNQSGTSLSSIRPEKESPQRKSPANLVTVKPLQVHRVAGETLVRTSPKAVATYAPRPDYPEEARSRRIAGNGVCVVSIDPFSGNVAKASMAESTGSPILDKSVLRTLRTWKFKPGTVSQVSIPVEFEAEEENR